MAVNSFPAPQIIGQLPTFGTFGPTYRVLESIRQTQSGDWLLRIQPVETGEETEYSYSHALNDPRI